MAPEWNKIIASWLAGFVAACFVQVLAVAWQEQAQKRLLRKSLYRELVTIYVGLRKLLPHLTVEGTTRREPNPANFPEFVKADCFNTAKSSPLFWRLKDAFGIVQAHTNFGFLVASNPKDLGAAAIDVGQVLNVFRGLIDNSKLCRRDLLRNSDRQLTKAELTARKP
jgi:hypothetical protein